MEVFLRGFNDRREIVGHVGSYKSGFKGFFWSPEAGRKELGTLGGKSSFAYAMNQRGEVVGAAEVADGSSHAFLWTLEKGLEDLGTLGGGE